MPPKRYPRTILATCPIPWTESYELAEAVFRSEVQRLLSELTSSLYIFGTAGEGYAVTDAQFEHITRIFATEMPPNAHAMVGIISLSLPTVIQRIELAHQFGIREFQLSLPSWGELTDHEVEIFFQETCGRFPDCRFLHYNLTRAKRLLRGVDYARLAAAHPNLVAVKMGGENPAGFADILAAAPALQCFFTEFGYAAMRDRFDCGLLASFSTINLSLAKTFFAARGERLAALSGELRTVHQFIKNTLGTEAHMDGAYDKLYSKIRDPNFPLRLLPPYSSASDETFAKLRRGLPARWRQSSPQRP